MTETNDAALIAAQQHNGTENTPSNSKQALQGSLAFYARPSGPQLLGRTQEFFRWQNLRRSNGVWPYSAVLQSSVAPSCTVATELGEVRTGLNFASQDYLALAQHPAVHEAIIKALRDFGPHSAGAPSLQGNTALSLSLERGLSEHLKMEHVMLFPTGWAAGYGTVTALVRDSDWIVMDELAHACIQAGAAAATRNVRRFKHLQTGQVEDILAEIRENDATGGILVITEGLFSMDADIPDLRRVQNACREYSATLMVDIAHDYGAMGPSGTGSLGIQKLLGEVDLVMGSFSKTFASNGGFLATNSKSVREFVKTFSSPHVFSNGLSPLQAAAIGSALAIVRGPEGEERRKLLMTSVDALRAAFANRGITCLGSPSPIVPVPVGNEDLTRLTARALRMKGLFANMVEFPAVPRKKARFRFQVMATHEPHQADQAAEIFTSALTEAGADLETVAS